MRQISEGFEDVLRISLNEKLTQFSKRLQNSPNQIALSIQIKSDDKDVVINFCGKEENSSLILPKPRTNAVGNQVIGGEIDRVICPMMIVQDAKSYHINYQQMILFLLLGNLEEHFPNQGKRSNLSRIFHGFMNGRGRLATRLCQRFLNRELFNLLPLSREPLQDWAMNHRLMIFDPNFAGLAPDKKLAYQIEKNRLMHPWGSIGISDGAAAKNYILQTDLRKITPFGLFHNPQRNLYSTLGMKGEELPLIVSQTGKNLEDKGITRKGWNWMTAFLDLPLNFEDQILIDKRHAGKIVEYRRSFTIFGRTNVSPGQRVLTGQPLGVQDNGSPLIFDTLCDKAVVESVRETLVPFDGLEQLAQVISLKLSYELKEGFKITNAHGNKGIIRLFDLGIVHDPVRGDIPLDVIVSAKSIQKRKNFGQVMEALTTLAHGCEQRFILPDDFRATDAGIKQSLLAAGQNPEGICQISTPWGQFQTICGWVHWGVIKTPEEQLWSKQDTWIKDNQGIRKKGNKLSAVELRAMITQFGPESKVVAEVLSQQQGRDIVKEDLRTLAALVGKKLDYLPVVNPERFIYLPTGLGTFHTRESLQGTLADQRMYPQGCYLQLPIRLEIKLPNNPQEESYEGVALPNAYPAVEEEGVRKFYTDILYIPKSSLREPWAHPTGLFGMSDSATSLNQILEDIDRLRKNEIKEGVLARSIFKYVHMVSKTLSSKVGRLANYLMSVRYPWSSKATAVLGSDLAENWIEIHKDMAKDLNVKTGDYVLTERFPCLGFMSIRVQRVKVTDDPQCKFTIRVSGNSLVSQNLDFDGDVLFIMSFQTAEAKAELEQAFHNPHPEIKKALEILCARKKPFTGSCTLSEIGLRIFEDLEPEEHAKINGANLGVKLHTGPVVALVYNLQRIVEGTIPFSDREDHIVIESLMDKVGNSVFSQKHGQKSLREECIEAVCLADVPALVKLGMPEKQAQRLCSIIIEKAEKLGIRGQEALLKHYQRHLEVGSSSIINAIVRRFHPIYFATRSNLHPILLLESLLKEANDLPSYLIKRGLKL